MVKISIKFPEGSKLKGKMSIRRAIRLLQLIIQDKLNW